MAHDDGGGSFRIAFALGALILLVATVLAAVVAVALAVLAVIYYPISSVAFVIGCTIGMWLASPSKRRRP